MRIQTYKSLSSPQLREAWHAMEQRQTPYLYLDYVQYVWHHVSYFTLYRPLVQCVLSEAGDILMIVPLKWDPFKRSCKMLTDIQGCGVSDALFAARLSAEERCACARLFYSQIKSKYKLQRLSYDSPMFAAAPAEAQLKHEDMKCVKICFHEGVEQHLKNLSRSVRQNIRTAYNRLSRDGVSYELQVLRDTGTPVPEALWSEMMSVYLQRLFSKHKVKANHNPVYKYLHFWKYHHLKHDTKSLRMLPNSFHAVLRGNGSIMAFLSGFVSTEGDYIVVPRLAIDISYRFYSPGYVLLVETLKYLEANTPCRVLDLSRGIEQYKTDLGGEMYYTARVIRK